MEIPVLDGVSGAAATIIAAVVGMVGIILGATVSAFMGRWGGATAQRREAYAAAIETIVAWAEFPYRVRRRTSDDPDELRRLADLGHDLQERLRCHETWIATESGWVLGVYRQVLEGTTVTVGAAVKAAWDAPPVNKASGMNLNGWGPDDLMPELKRLQSAVACRFGWRRALGPLHPGVLSDNRNGAATDTRTRHQQ